MKPTVGGGRMLGGRSKREGAGEGTVSQGLTFLKYPLTGKNNQPTKQTNIQNILLLAQDYGSESVILLPLQSTEKKLH